MKKLATELAPLLLTAALLSATANLLAGRDSIAWTLMPWFSAEISFVFVFIFFYALVTIAESIVHARRFTDALGQVDTRALWLSLLRSPQTGIASTMIVGYGIMASSNLVEIYRMNVSAWNDKLLWGIEEPLFLALLNSWLDIPSIWDNVYVMFWPFIFLASAIIFRKADSQQFILLAMAFMISFYLNGIINLAFPTAGPAFYRPELFHVEGTVSGGAQEILRQYMAGKIQQNGIMPGTRAMPSLHVGLTGMLAFFVVRAIPSFSLLLVPWLLLTWLSTIMLGWHYALDGPAGLVVAWVSVVIARAFQKSYQMSVTYLWGR